MNAYKILGINKNSTRNEINAAYKKLMIKHHPDKNGGELTEQYQQIQQSYQELIKLKKKDETPIIKKKNEYIQVDYITTLKELYSANKSKIVVLAQDIYFDIDAHVLSNNVIKIKNAIVFNNNPTDVHIHVQFELDSDYKIINNKIILMVNLEYQQSWGGFVHSVVHPSGKIFNLISPPTTVINPNMYYVWESINNLYIQFIINYPDKISPDQLKLEEIKDVSNLDNVIYINTLAKIVI